MFIVVCSVLYAVVMYIYAIVVLYYNDTVFNLKRHSVIYKGCLFGPVASLLIPLSSLVSCL